MKYSTFEQLVEDMGFNVFRSDSGRFLCVERETGFGRSILNVGIDMTNVILTHFTGFSEQSDGVREKLFNLAVELASTPLDEREDEKRYYVKFMEKVYLVYYPKSRNYGVVSTREGVQGKTQFTEQQIKKIDSRYWGFAEEVKEDE